MVTIIDPHLKINQEIKEIAEDEIKYMCNDHHNDTHANSHCIHETKDLRLYKRYYISDKLLEASKFYFYFPFFFIIYFPLLNFIKIFWK